MDSNRSLARRIGDLERKYDEQFAVVFEAIRQLIDDETKRPAKSGNRIGFR